VGFLHENWPITYSYIKDREATRPPRLPGTSDRGAPLPEPSDERYVMVKVGEREDGSPIIEARHKPWPTA
jgi:hypothetical protein